MKKEYLLVSIGGVNGEIWDFEGRYDDLNEVLRLDLLDVNEVRFRNSYDEKDWEGYYGDMNDGLDEWINKDKESVNRVMLINEGLEMYELNVFN